MPGSGCQAAGARGEHTVLLTIDEEGDVEVRGYLDVDRLGPLLPYLERRAREIAEDGGSFEEMDACQVLASFIRVSGVPTTEEEERDG